MCFSLYTSIPWYIFHYLFYIYFENICERKCFVLFVGWFFFFFYFFFVVLRYGCCCSYTIYTIVRDVCLMKNNIIYIVYWKMYEVLFNCLREGKWSICYARCYCKEPKLKSKVHQYLYLANKIYFSNDHHILNNQKSYSI